ncbi:ABC transporter permease [Fredinandcohnia sp. 179-A 10B2 NHS]|uniref:ABC transporter permease n=1 Tax=Fredinandcohnia sp. 179-A 10B2 NHS TaxID=3235176 RepID=UPI0039A333CB
MLRKIYIKELKDSFRDRRTLLLTVFLPIIMMTGLTLFYEKMISDGIDESYNLAVEESAMNEVESIFSGFDNIELIPASNLEAVLKEGEAHAALSLSPEFTESVQNGEQATITLLGDSFSQKSSNLMNIITNTLAGYEKVIITDRLQVQGMNPELIKPFTIEQKEITEENQSVDLLAMLIPLILSIAIGVGSGPSAADLFAGEKEKKTMEALLMTPVKRSTLLFSKWLTIATIGSVIGIITLIVVALEISLLTENLKNAVDFGDQGILIVGIAVGLSIIYAAFNASILMLTSIIGKTIKESQSYSSPVMMICMFPALMITGVGVNELTAQHFAIPIMNLFSLLKELLFGIVNAEHILLTLGSNVICMVIIFIIGRILFMKDKWVMN